MGNASYARDSIAQIPPLAIALQDASAQEQTSSARHARIHLPVLRYLIVVADIPAIQKMKNASGATIHPHVMQLMHAAQDMDAWLKNASRAIISNALIQLHATALRDAVVLAQTKTAMPV